jgi:hypothetical protein
VTSRYLPAGTNDQSTTVDVLKGLADFKDFERLVLACTDEPRLHRTEEQDRHHNRDSTTRASWASPALREGGAHSERKMDGGRNRIVARHERRGGLIGCSKWRRAREGKPRFRTYYRAGQPPMFAR